MLAGDLADRDDGLDRDHQRHRDRQTVERRVSLMTKMARATASESPIALVAASLGSIEDGTPSQAIASRPATGRVRKTGPSRGASRYRREADEPEPDEGHEPAREAPRGGQDFPGRRPRTRRPARHAAG